MNACLAKSTNHTGLTAWCGSARSLTFSVDATDCIACLRAMVQRGESRAHALLQEPRARRGRPPKSRLKEKRARLAAAGFVLVPEVAP